jgi:hypothetical protein
MNRIRLVTNVRSKLSSRSNVNSKENELSVKNARNVLLLFSFIWIQDREAAIGRKCWFNS